jgi:hypothetical protein
MRTLRRKIRAHDVFYWVNAYVKALSGQELSRFTAVDEYSPSSTAPRHTRRAAKYDSDAHRQASR